MDRAFKEKESNHKFEILMRNIKKLLIEYKRELGIYNAIKSPRLPIIILRYA